MKFPPGVMNLSLSRSCEDGSVEGDETGFDLVGEAGSIVSLGRLGRDLSSI